MAKLGGANKCGCSACNPFIKPRPAWEEPPKLTQKERIHRQRLALYKESEETRIHVQENQGRYAAHREKILAEQKVASLVILSAAIAAESEAALSAAIAANKITANDEMETQWLKVPRGQLTFDAEGNDTDGSMFFSRKVHVPNNKSLVIGSSGVTIGRGLDIGSRSAAEVEAIFNRVAQDANPISADLLQWLKSGAGKKKQHAYDHYLTLDSQVQKSEQQLTRKQQHFLFLDIYSEYEKTTKRLLTKQTVADEYGVVNYDSLSQKVKDVLVDLTYRGDNVGFDGKYGSTRKLIVPALVQDQTQGLSGEQSDFYRVMRGKYWVQSYGVDDNRYLKRYKAIE
ncbi:pesticin C-terminus-like muramidase [Shewanella sp. VB17]|uniref:pesticin C-terminus-like muramidase n=1 Tax=Shewanella sp. VB17 TaxID=2739432 RepID=UPI001C276F4F|nr:pesticin C-terminus-like muramidase [Shewanella sp. VB17]